MKYITLGMLLGLPLMMGCAATHALVDKENNRAHKKLENQIVVVNQYSHFVSSMAIDRDIEIMTDIIDIKRRLEQTEFKWKAHDESWQLRKK